MGKLKLWGPMLGMVTTLSLAACSAGTRGEPAVSPMSPGSDSAASEALPEHSAQQEAQAPASAPGGAYGESEAPAPATMPSSEARASSQDVAGGAPMRREAAPPENRPGLGTAWGETRHSPTTSAPFVRDTAAPFAVAALWYNDRTGADAMARWADYRTHARGAVPVLGGALTVSLRDESGRLLDGFFAGGKDYVVGEAGTRYAIVIQNNTGYRYECVASVDGLDVIDGRTAAYTKRGYLIQPHGTLEIDGFRRSSDAVAAFRFSSVRGSYAAKSGKSDRNVGVIGIAFFNEEGARPTWSPDELRRRHSADPFPGRYAEPPQ